MASATAPLPRSTLPPAQPEHRNPVSTRTGQLQLGNGWCARPRGTDCTFEAICEGCGYYQTSIEFAPTLRAQRDHAASHGQATRVQLYGALLDRLEASR